MKHYLYTLIILTFFSCSKREPEKPNTPPQAFEVTAKAEGTNVTLTWTEAVDPDGDAVTYAVVYGDTLAKGLTQRTFTIKDLPYETEISGTVVASDGRGGKTESGFRVITSENPYVLIPDVEFEKYLISKGYDTFIDGKVDRKNVKNIKRFGDFNLISNTRFKSLQGIEAFESLEAISFLCPNLIEVDFQHNKKLKSITLHSSGWAMTKINVSGNQLLDSLTIHGNRLTELDLSNNANLRFLYCPNNFLKTLDLSKNPKLTSLYVSNNKLTGLNLSNNRALIELYCKDNEIINICLHSEVKPGLNWQKDATATYKVCD